MQIFRQFGQEPETTDVRQLTGYQQLTPEAQKVVSEAYQNTYLANQSKGFKIASGIAFATAKFVLEQMKGDDLQGNLGVPVTSGVDDVGMAEEDSGDKQKENVKDKESKEDKAPDVPSDKDYRWGDSPATPSGAEEIQHKNWADKGFGPKTEEVTPMTEEEYQIFETAVTDSIRTAKKQGYSLSGEPKQSQLGMSFKLTHPSGHTLHVHTSQNGMGWSHTHKNGTRKSGDNPHSMSSHLNDLEEKHIGWKKMVHKLEGQGHSPESSNKIAGYINAKKNHLGKFAENELAADPSKPITVKTNLGTRRNVAASKKNADAERAKAVAAYKSMKEAEDAHGNQLTKVDRDHPSYKAGASFGKKIRLKNPMTHSGLVHSAAIVHSKDTDDRKSTLQDKLHMQRQFKAGAHHELGLPKPKGLEEKENAKQIQTKNFEEKCDYCGKVHTVGPCPAMQESEWTGTSPATPPDYECGGDWGEGPHPDAASLLKKNHTDKGMSESEWGEPEDHEPGVTYDHEMREAAAKEVGGLKPLKTMRSHVAFGHHINHELGPVVGHTARHDNVPSPYAYSPTDQVHHWNGKNVFTRETKHKHYQTFEVPKTSKIHKNEEDATTEYIKRKHPDYKGPTHSEQVVHEMDKHALCFCGHEYGSHNSNGCKSCHREGHVRPQMASHKFKLNSQVDRSAYGESIDPTLQAAVDYIANRVNVKGIMENAMPAPKLLTRDKWSNTLVEDVPHPQSGQKLQDPTHKKTAYHKALADHGYEYKHTEQGDYGKWHHYEHPIHGTARTFHHDSGHHAYHLRKHGDNMNWAEGKGRKHIEHDLSGQKKRHDEKPQRDLFDTGKN